MNQHYSPRHHLATLPTNGEQPQEFVEVKARIDERIEADQCLHGSTYSFRGRRPLPDQSTADFCQRRYDKFDVDRVIVTVTHPLS